MIGQVVRDYEILREIDTGGYGAVYLAREITVQRHVAIKVILPFHADKPEFRQRFAAEAQLIARLEHPHIVPLYSYWQDHHGAFLVMRYVAGGSLRQVINRRGLLPVSQVMRILRQISDALMIAHEAGVVHRDL